MLALKSRLGGELGKFILALESGRGGGELGVYMLSHRSSSDSEIGTRMLALKPLLCGRGACILPLRPGPVGEGGE